MSTDYKPQKVYPNTTGNLVDTELVPKWRRNQHERWCQDFLKGLYEELNEGDGKAILRLKDLEDRHGVLEILKNDPELRVSEPVSLRGMGPSIMIVRKSS